MAGLATTDQTEKVLSDDCVRKSFASCTDEYVTSHFAVKLPVAVEKTACVCKVGVGVKDCISFSLSTMSLTATDCTRPALSQVLIFFHNNGES